MSKYSKTFIDELDLIVMKRMAQMGGYTPHREYTFSKGWLYWKLQEYNDYTGYWNTYSGTTTVARFLTRKSAWAEYVKLTLLGEHVSWVD